MDDVTRHPEDATLFDLVEGELEPAHVEAVERHLARCGACAAFVRAARAGAPVAGTAVETMPATSAERIHVALSAAWRERVAAVAAGEAARDAAASAEPDLGSSAGFAPTTPLLPEAPDGVSAPAAPRRRRGRRLVPVLAFVVLGTLAGTSIYVGERGDSGGDTASVQDVAPSAGGAVQQESAPEEFDKQAGTATGGSAEARPEAPVASAGSQAGRDNSATAGSSGDADTAAATPPPTSKSATAVSGSVLGTSPQDGTDIEDTCIATRDETQLVLPGGRLAQEILTAPFGIYVVCG